MTAAHVGKTLAKVVDRIVNVFKEGAVLTTNYSDPAYEKWKQDVSNVFHDTGADTAEEARSEAQERLTKHLMDKGWSREQAERWVEARWKDAVDGAEKIKRTAPKMGARIAGFVGATAAIFAGALSVAVVQGRIAAHKTEESLGLLRRTEAEQQEVQKLSRIVLTDADFKSMNSAFFAPSAQAPAPAAAAAPPMALPAAIAAVAARPARLEETSPSGGTRTVETTVGEIYERSPRPVQEVMERSPPTPLHIEHDYDKPSVDDCLKTDCLGAIDRQFHKDYVVTSGDGSMSISVSVQH
jgi:hypothetical protein